MKSPSLKKIIFNISIVIILFLIDRVSKIYILNFAEVNGVVNIYVNQFINLILVWNTGIGFGLLSFDGSIFYHTISFLILMIIIYLIYLMVMSDNLGKIIFSIIIGGASGNLYDRLTYFAVPDFIDFHINNLHWFTFNLADIFISIGIFAMIIRELIFNK